MSTFIGYYRTNDAFAQEIQQRQREGQPIDARFIQMVVDLPGKLPASCKIIGSYSPAAGPVLGPQPPSIQIVETNDPRDLQFISQYYGGYLQFHWVPATVVGANRQEREAWREVAQTEPAGVR